MGTVYRSLCGSILQESLEASNLLFYLGLACFYAIMLCFVTLKVQNLQSGWGSAPDPDGGAYSAPPYPLAGGGRVLPRPCTYTPPPPPLLNPGSAPGQCVTVTSAMQMQVTNSASVVNVSRERYLSSSLNQPVRSIYMYS